MSDKVEVGSYIKHDREWYRYSITDDVGDAQVIAMGDDWALLEEDQNGLKVLYPESPERLEPHLMPMGLITLSRLDELLSAERHLEALQAAGVDNWTGYVPLPEDDEDDEDEPE